MFFFVPLCIIGLVTFSKPMSAMPSLVSQAVEAAEDFSQEIAPDIKLEDRFGYCPRYCSKKSAVNPLIQYNVCMNRCICSAYCDYSVSEGGLTQNNYRLCVGLCVMADPYSENPETWNRDPSCCPTDPTFALTKKDEEFGCSCL